MTDNNPTTKDIMGFLAQFREDMETGFFNVRSDIQKIDDRLVAVEAKIDRALFKEIDRLEAEIKKIKEHVGLK